MPKPQGATGRADGQLSGRQRTLAWSKALRWPGRSKHVGSSLPVRFGTESSEPERESEGVNREPREGKGAGEPGRR